MGSLAVKVGLCFAAATLGEIHSIPNVRVLGLLRSHAELAVFISPSVIELLGESWTLWSAIMNSGRFVRTIIGGGMITVGIVARLSQEIDMSKIKEDAWQRR
jgi:hypothetical protein